LLVEQAAILADLPLPATALAKEREATVRAWDAMHQPRWHWQRMSGTRRTSGAMRKPLQNNARRVSIFIYLHWPILMNNMSTEDDCNLAPFGLIQLKGSVVLNENAIESINYYSDGCCTGTPSKTVEAVDATESIINNSDGCCKATTSNRRNPSRDLSGDSVAQGAGVVIIKAVDELVSKFALKKEWLKYKDALGEYPKCYKGLRKCHLRALYSDLPKAAQSAPSKKIKHHEASETQECLQLFKGPFGGKVFCLHGTH
jgi:hypothetical protein